MTDRLFVSEKTIYLVSGFVLSHCNCGRRPNVLKAEGAGLGDGRPEVLNSAIRSRPVLPCGGAVVHPPSVPFAGVLVF
jgi:hypothetical protein